jgi:hypothetical protein
MISICATVFLCALVGAALDGEAGGSGSSNSGQIALLIKKPPSNLSFREARSFAGKFEIPGKYKIKEVRQNDQREWIFYTMTMLSQSLTDYDLEIVLYDVSRGRSSDKRRLVKSIYHHTIDPSSRNISGKVNLTRPEFDANLAYQMVARSYGRDLAKAVFITRGESTQSIEQAKRLEEVQKELTRANDDLERRLKHQKESEAGADTNEPSTPSSR